MMMMTTTTTMKITSAMLTDCLQSGTEGRTVWSSFLWPAIARWREAPASSTPGKLWPGLAMRLPRGRSFQVRPCFLGSDPLCRVPRPLRSRRGYNKRSSSVGRLPYRRPVQSHSIDVGRHGQPASYCPFAAAAWSQH